MATIETICKFNQTGFCKFLSHCRNQHVMDICPTVQCKDMNCVLRHPRTCKFFSNFGRCKFDEECAYLHNSRNQTIDLEIRELESELRRTKTKIKELKNFQERMDKLETIQKASEEIDMKMSDRVFRIESILEERNQPKPFVEGNQISELEEKLGELSQNFYILMNSVDDLERSSKLLKFQLEALYDQNRNLKCGICGQNF